MTRPFSLIACLLAVSFTGGRASGQARPDILLVSIDTLRADHVSFAGHTRPTTPHLDQWAARSVVFEQAFSSSSWTPPSVASYLTGLLPIRHGMHGGPTRVADDVTTLAEMLAAEGYETRAVVQNAWFDEVFGFAQGFESYKSYDFIGSPLCHESVEADVREWVARDRDRPFFLWLHYFAPHCPYVPRPPWIDSFSPDGGPRHFEQVDFDQMVSFKHRQLPPGALTRMLALYDSEIRFVDEHVGGLLDGLEREGHLEQAITVVLSDHGEEFKDHGSLGHYATLHDELVRVPFLLHLPGQSEGHRHADPVSTLDLVPTLRALVGLPPLPLDGLGLLHRAEEGPLLSSLGAFEVQRADDHVFSFRYAQPYQARHAADVLRAAVAEEDRYADVFHRNWLSQLFSVRDERFTLVCETPMLDLERSQAIDGTHSRADEIPFLAHGRLYRYRLYDRWADPDEQVDVIDDHPETARELARRLRETFRTGGLRLPQIGPERLADDQPVDVDPAVEEALGQLGYTSRER